MGWLPYGCTFVRIEVDADDAAKGRPLTDDEFVTIKSHTVAGEKILGNKLFYQTARQIARSHHERWDGRGYPGKIDNIFARGIRFGPGKRGKEIPLAARIVALADVYDALMSKRSYKDSWKEEQAVRYIRVQSGRQFDPELVALFRRIYDTIRAIRKRYS